MALKSVISEKIEMRRVADLKPYAKNARTHSNAQIDQIAASIAEWGWTIPVLIDERGQVIAGHGRLMAAKRAGIDEVPCIVATGWTAAQKKAYVLADNKLTENGGWDKATLADELRGLAQEAFDLKLTGFTGEFLTKDDSAALSIAATYEVTAECVDEAEQKRIYDLLIGAGVKCRISTL